MCILQVKVFLTVAAAVGVGLLFSYRSFEGAGLQFADRSSQCAGVQFADRRLEIAHSGVEGRWHWVSWSCRPAGGGDRRSCGGRPGAAAGGA